MRLDLQWAPREENEHADALTNGDYSEFDPRRRVKVELSRLPFEVLDAYMKASEALYADVRAQRTTRRAQPQGAAPRKRKALRETDPW